MRLFRTCQRLKNLTAFARRPNLGAILDIKAG